MFNLQDHLQTIIQFLHTHPHSAGIITFFVVFAEAMAVIGVIVPGTVTMSAIGMLIGAGVIPAGSTFLWAICGAICGDYLSYIIGVHYQDKLHKVWPFKKRPHLLSKSEEFFKKHGGKSVIIGRFFGPMRAMVPMVAGMFKMPQGRFLLAAIPSASVWAVSYFIPGILLGALSLELPPRKATEFILGVLGILIIIWLLTWLIQLFAKQIYRAFDNGVTRIWKFLQTHKTLCWLPKTLEDPREPDNHQQLSLIIIALIAFISFLILFFSVIHAGILTAFNDPLYHFFTSFRAPVIDRLMVSITLIGEKKIILSAASLFLFWLIYKRYWYIAIHWFTLLICSIGFIVIMKNIIFFPRPSGILNVLHTSSFPSGHTFFTVTLFGFFAIVVARELTKTRRWIPYTIASVLTFCVALSRIFIGAHWLTDVIASILAGTSFVLLFTISYRRHHTIQFSFRQFTIVFASIFCAVWLLGNVVMFKPQVATYALQWPTKIINFKDWQQQNSKDIPLYRNNRLGKPIQAFNIEWKGDLDKIKSGLLQQGWQQQDITLDLRSILGRLIGDSVISHLPLLPQTYHNKPPVLLLTKNLNKNKTILILRLWQSDLNMKNGVKPFWLGVVDYSKLQPKLFILPPKKWHHKHKKFIGATDKFSEYLPDYHWKQVTYPLTQQPKEMHALDWDGKVLLIWEIHNKL